MKLIDSSLAIVLNNGGQEFERELVSSADALRVALMMLARRGRLEIGDVLKVMAPSRTTMAGGVEKVHEHPCLPSARTSAHVGGPDQ